MSLPMQSTPVYTLTIPSTQKEFKYRPFLVKDEKALMIAQKSEDPQVMLDTIADVIRSCAKSDIDVDKLATFDIEYIFMKLRAVSIGEVVELLFACDEDHGEDNSKAISTVGVDLTTCVIENFEGHTLKIPLYDDVGVMMKYPPIKLMDKMSNLDSLTVDEIFDIISACIDYIYTEDEVFPIRDQKKDEVIKFLDNLSSTQFDKIQNFFRTMPKLRVYIKYTCPVCGKEHNKYMEGLESFF